MEEKEFLEAHAQADNFATQEPPAANLEYKDRLFKAIFGRNTAESKCWRLDLYNALNGTAYTDPDALKLTTIENVIYVTMKNDISFLIRMDGTGHQHRREPQRRASKKMQGVV